MRFKVVLTWHDDGAFGYTAPDMEEVVRDRLTLAEAKAIYRHYVKKYWYAPCTVWVYGISDDGTWYEYSQYWAHREMEEEERWFREKGLDYDWYLYSGEITEVK